jgi:NAD(P)-dependent dehydrogenase (short-subunit alcohol dehydrogenase family)
MGLSKQPRAVVTGAGSGLGRAFCIEIVKRNGRVIASDVDEASARATADLLKGAATPVRCDVTKVEEVEALAALAERDLGGVDLVVNNAGVAVGGKVGEVSMEDWRWLMGVNLWGVIHGCHVFVPRLRKQGGGHIINIASAAGFAGMPLMAPYCVAKSGVMALSEALYCELASAHVGVTVVCPTFFKTNIGKSSRGPEGIEQVRAMTEKLMDAGKLSAEDVARHALKTADAGDLYAIPMADARWLWRIKRLMPQRFLGIARTAALKQAKKFGVNVEL